MSNAALETLASLPTIVLDSPNTAPSFEPAVQFTTAVYGIHAAGTAYRMDEVPIPLRKLIDTTYPTDAEVLQTIARRIREAPEIGSDAAGAAGGKPGVKVKREAGGMAPGRIVRRDGDRPSRD